MASKVRYEKYEMVDGSERHLVRQIDDKSLKKRFDRTQKKFLAFVILIILWIPFHEILHYSVCFLSGCDGQIVLDFFNQKTECPEIEKKTIFVQYVYYIIPYIVELILVLVFIFVDIGKIILQPIPYVAILDVLVNYFLPVDPFNDFNQIAKLSTTFFYFSVVIVLITSLGAIFYFSKKDYGSVKKFITKQTILQRRSKN